VSWRPRNRNIGADILVVPIAVGIQIPLCLMHPSPPRQTLVTPDLRRKKMTEQTKESAHLCDCEHRLPFAVLTVWICQFCGEVHEIVTNCACGKCVQLEWE